MLRGAGAAAAASSRVNRAGSALIAHEAAEPGVPGEMDHPHPAFAQLACDLVLSELATDQRRLRASVVRVDRTPVRGGQDHRVRAVVVVREKRLDLGPQRGIVTAGVVEKPRALTGAARQRVMKQIADALPALRIHQRGQFPSPV